MAGLFAASAPDRPPVEPNTVGLTGPALGKTLMARSTVDTVYYAYELQDNSCLLLHRGLSPRHAQTTVVASGLPDDSRQGML